MRLQALRPPREASIRHSMTRPLLLGHRGARASKNFPENTLASYELCLHHGCDGFEFDVRLSADGQAVICHDATTRGMKIEKTTSTILELPALSQVLQQFAHRAFLDIELKVPGLERQTLNALSSHPPQKEFVVSSFLPAVLTAIHDLDPSVPLGLLCDTRAQLKSWRDFPAQWIIPRYDLAKRELIQQIHDAGKRAMLWTVNSADRMRQFAEWGVDAIISDETERLVKVLRDQQ
jgi:glycerophosphoryl diester phosphodiesterase